MTNQPEALRWAAILAHQAHCDGPLDYKHKAARLLREQHAEIEELREANEALRRDAERYRWLTEDHPKQETRGQVYSTTLLFNVRRKEHIDAAIDAAAAIRARGET